MVVVDIEVLVVVVEPGRTVVVVVDDEVVDDVDEVGTVTDVDDVLVVEEPPGIDVEVLLDEDVLVDTEEVLGVGRLVVTIGRYRWALTFTVFLGLTPILGRYALCKATLFESS